MSEPQSESNSTEEGEDLEAEGREAEEAVEADRPALERYRSLSRRARRSVAFIVFFVVLHISTVLVKGLKPEFRKILWPAFSWYGDGLRMATTWGMFGAKHTNASLYSVGVDSDGTRHPIFPRPLTEQGALERLTDLRLRKIQSNLKKEKNHKNWGAAYGRYWCDNPPRGLHFAQVRLETADDYDEKKFPRKAVVKVSCRDLEVQQ